MPRADPPSATAKREREREIEHPFGSASGHNSGLRPQCSLGMYVFRLLSSGRPCFWDSFQGADAGGRRSHQARSGPFMGHTRHTRPMRCGWFRGDGRWICESSVLSPSFDSIPGVGWPLPPQRSEEARGPGRTRLQCDWRGGCRWVRLSLRASSVGIESPVVICRFVEALIRSVRSLSDMSNRMSLEVGRAFRAFRNDNCSVTGTLLPVMISSRNPFWG